MRRLSPVLALACLWAGPAQAQEAATPPVVRDSTPIASVTLTAVGDIRLDGPVAALMARDGRAAPFSGLGGRLRADIVFGNLECPLTKRGRRKADKKWTFRARPESLAALKAAGFTLLNIANNHVMDFGPDGLLDTIQTLRRDDIPFVGGGKNRDEAEKLYVAEVRGLKIGFMGFTSTFPEDAWAGPRRPGVAYGDFNRAGAVIRNARPACDVLVVSFHGGTELSEEPNEVQKAFARLAIESGADLVLGHHPHVIEPLELVGGKPVLHSLGNFLFVSPTPSTRPTLAARATLSARGVERIEFIALDTNWGRPGPASQAQRQALKAVLDRYGALSAQPERFQVVE